MKRTAVLALLVACIITLAACQPAAAPPSEPTSAPLQTGTAVTSTTSPAATTAPTPTTQPPIKITWVGQCDAPVDTSSLAVQEFFKLFNVEVEWLYFERSQIADLLQLHIASGDIPDVMWINGNRSMYTNFAQQGVLAEIPLDYIQENMPSVWAGTNEICGESNWYLNFVNGKNYGIPTPFAENIYPYVPIIRDDWLSNVGIDKLPVTLEEFEQAFYAFANDDPDGNGNKDTYALSVTGFNPIFGAFGGIPREAPWQRRGDEVVYVSTLPEMLDALTLLAKWYKDGLIDPEFITGENKGQHFANTVPFWNGIIGYSAAGMHYHINGIYTPDDPTDLGSTNYQQFKAIQGEDATYVPIKPPIGANGTTGTRRPGTEGAAPDLLLGVQCETDRIKYDKIMEIAERENSDYDVFLLSNSGLEGVHYELSGDPMKPYRTLLDPSDPLAGPKQGLSATGMRLVRNNLEFQNAIANGYAVEYKKQFLDWPSYTNFVRLQLPSAAMYESQINTARDEGYWSFITGQRPCTQEEWDKFIAELNALGLETLVSEAQDYLREYYR